MRKEEALWARELGTAVSAGAFGHRPPWFEAVAAADAGLAKRLAETAQLAGHGGSVNAVGWSDCGSLLVTGGEDCRLRIWRGGSSAELLNTFDSARLLLLLLLLLLQLLLPRACPRSLQLLTATY